MEKSLVTSKTIWGVIVAAIPAASEAINHALGTGLVPPQVAPWLVLGGSLLAVLGRVTAQGPITSVLPKS